MRTRLCTKNGTDIQPQDRQLGWVPTDPLPPWVLDRRRAIGDTVRTVRTARKLSQERLGEMVDLDRKTINRIEQGSYSTLLDHLLLIARALDVPLADLVR